MNPRRKKILFQNLLILPILLGLTPANLSAHRGADSKLKTIDIASTRLSWGIALTGNVLAQPVRTGDGFIAVTEGNMLTSFTQKGRKLWEKQTGGTAIPLISNGHAGTLLLASEGNKISMLRSDGSTIWQSTVDFTITKPPVAGRDGRIFVFGKDRAASIGTKGTVRWSAELPGQNEKLPPLELNDGSLLSFMETPSPSGNTVAAKISPFGEFLGIYELPGNASSSVPTSNGGLVGFSDGSVILVSEEDGNIYFDWRIDTERAGDIRLLADRLSNEAYIVSGETVRRVATRTGETLAEFQVPFQSGGLTYLDINLQGLVMSDSATVACYSETGKTEWIAKLDERKKNRYILASDDGHLMICTASWVIESYRARQLPTAKVSDSFVPPQAGSYEKLYERDRKIQDGRYGGLFTNVQASSIEKKLRQGNFGAEEKEWISLLTSELVSLESDWSQSISQTQTQKAYLAENLDYAFKLLDMVSSFETIQYQRNIAALIHGTTDVRRMTKLIQTAGQMAFDPGYLMLNEMERVAQKYNKADTILALICDATVQICSFMGRDAFREKGRNILSMMMGSKYSIQTRDTARASLERLRAQL